MTDELTARVRRLGCAAAALLLATALSAVPAAAQTQETPAPAAAAGDTKGGETAVEQEKQITDEVKVEEEAPKTRYEQRQEKRETITGDALNRQAQDREPVQREPLNREKMTRTPLDRRKIR